MEIELMLIEDLVINEMASKIYSIPRNYEEIRESIRRIGIINPILVNEEDNMIISGNLRYTIACSLNMEDVPVIRIQINNNQDINDLLLLSNTQRDKSLLDKYNENEYINSLFNLRQGTRTDLSQEFQEEKELKKQMKSILSAAEIDYFGRINSLAKKKFGEENYKQEVIDGLKKIDEREITRNAFKNILKKSKSTIKDNNKKKGNIIKIYLDKEGAIEQIEKILNKVSLDLHEEILLHFLSQQTYAMAS
jgi:ParB-like chromosome segregation protein Spo0J